MILSLGLLGIVCLALSITEIIMVCVLFLIYKVAGGKKSFAQYWKL